MPGSQRNVADLVRACAHRDPGHPALIAESPNAGVDRLTWLELDDQVDEVCRGLVDRGLRRGDRVALRLANTTDFVIAYFAILRAGLVAVPVNPGYTARELRHIVDDCGAAMLLSAAELPEPTGLVEHPIGVDVLLEIPRGQRSPEADATATAGGEDLAALIYTSGTTGVPKGAMLSHRALLANLDQCAALQPSPMTSDDVVLLAIPLFHIYGLNAALGMIAYTGATGVLLQRFDVDASLALMSAHGVTNVPGAPPIYLAWLAGGDREQLRRALSHVRLATSGAAPLPADVLETMGREFGVDVHEGYGLTETAPVLTSTLVTGRVKPGSIGQAIPGVELRLGDTQENDSDDEDEEDEDGDATGEIQVRGANLFLGYWPDASGGPDAQGWFATGDVAYRDADDDLHLVDRRRDLILVNGFNVYPREVELELAGHTQIAEAAVLGVEDAVTGEGVRAIVVLVEGSQLSEAEVRDYAATRLARFKCPTSVEIVEELPHSVTGKVSKARLRELGFADVRPTDAAEGRHEDAGT